jgi:hypothetical protein
MRVFRKGREEEEVWKRKGRSSLWLSFSFSW